MREPAFWGDPPGLTAGLLSPFGAAYGAVAAWRMRQPGGRAGIPVICIGNLTLGGAGKTPTAIAVAGLLKAAGRRPFILSRGYGGAEKGPLQVDPQRHRATDVGDEPLLLARSAATVVAGDRAAGAVAARTAGADVLVMDDGFQNPALHKDRAIVVVDGRRGVGNGHVFPAGPLRAPLEAQIGRANAVLVIGAGEAGESIATRVRRMGRPVFHGAIEPADAAIAALRGQPLLAFAGIGDPEKFFTTLREAGLDVRQAMSFADHHPYRRAEAADILAKADREGLVPVTTEKDLARLAGQPDVAALAGVTRTLPIRLAVAEDEAFRTFVLGVLS